MPYTEVKNHTPETKPWVRRLVENQGLPLTEKAMGWWSVHLEGFLRYAAKRGESLDPVVPGKGYLQMLDETLPPSAGFRRDQTKQALTAFVRGIENWHWEDSADGCLRPRFRFSPGPTSIPMHCATGTGAQITVNQNENRCIGLDDRQDRRPSPESPPDRETGSVIRGGSSPHLLPLSGIRPSFA